MKRETLNDEKCWFCQATQGLERHHVFEGPNRKLSEKYGLCVWLCQKHHNTAPDGVHFNFENRMKLCEDVQKIAMARYGWSVDDFIRIFGRNWLNEENET